MSENTAIILLLVLLIGVPIVIAALFENVGDAIAGAFDRTRAKQAAGQRRLESTLPATTLEPTLAADLATHGWALSRHGPTLIARSPRGEQAQLQLSSRGRLTLVTVSAPPASIDQVAGEVLAVLRHRDPAARVRAIR